MPLEDWLDFDVQWESEAVTECGLEVGSLVMMGETSDKRLLILNGLSMFGMWLCVVDRRTRTNGACVQSSFFS